LTKIAIQGETGSFHHLAAESFLPEASLVCCETFEAVFARLEDKTADKAVIAIENSLYGSIAPNYDLLLKYRYPIIGESIQHIHQNLIGFGDTKLTDIHQVYSHPVALDQCRKWLTKYLPHAERIEYSDTAAAVEHIKSHTMHRAAAIAGTQAAQLHQMQILQSSIEDKQTNLTRFLLLDPHSSQDPSANKASLVLTTSHDPGALYRALKVFADLTINLTKLESRPIRGESFKYQFFVDIIADKAALANARRQLTSQGCDTVLLGHYHHHQI